MTLQLKHSSRQRARLPEPPDELKQKSAELVKKIRQRLQRHGQLPFSDYMQMALYTPGLGYYTSGLPKIGRGGDFVTAPEISPLFSRCLAQQVAQGLSELDAPNIIEFGAGRGTMARDLLLALDQTGQAERLQQYCILELSADLKQRQQAMLKDLPSHLADKVVWLSELPQTPMEAVVLANEVLDAMPFERLRLEPEQALRAYVQYNDEQDALEWAYQPIVEPELQRISNQLLKQLGSVSDRGYDTEVNLNLYPWLQSLHDSLKRGLVLLIDYGYNRQEYYQRARHMGTLRCHYQHLAHSDPFFYPGLQDITAHVDFTAVAENAFSAGFKIAGFTTQAHFLMSSGLMDMAHRPDDDVTEQLKLAQQIKTLTLPDEMGETFKVMALSKHLDQSLIGFEFRDLRHQL
ncbi:MAG: SAM-dependent methyltransferase [Hydrogenovibrio sp.]|uniref:class I SAM-dependent methyltransferase n=1 Tax=Hydrogenovibrio sp. TaxID=2065821 RepID=UPI0028701DC6|nr:SAM-dependent methyltransferase [Hydrogenovibrio sp.]MDR9497994.1 SAM-dependent methyltransferase [Hydrogenovibrio sp.]